MGSFRTSTAALIAAFTLVGCASSDVGLGYYWQSVTGHMSVMWSARPLPQWIEAPDTTGSLRAKLERAREIRAFASDALGLPDNGSYRSYADLGRPYVLWNVFAAPELSLELRKSCFPIAGCVSYRGFYAQADAEQHAQALRAEGFDVYVAGVPAYSTLGYFDDPLLNTFIHYPDGEIARLVFHELAHQVAYVPGDSTFNESFATAVEEAGLARWLAAIDDPAIERAYAEHAARKREFRALLAHYRARLQAVYDGPGDDATRRAAKQALFASLQRDYAALRERWGGYAGYDRWFAQGLTNAHLASVATYTAELPAFRALLVESRDDLPRFYAAVRALAALPAEARNERLRALAVRAESASHAAADTSASLQAPGRAR